MTTATEARCEKHDLLIRDCADCNPRPDAIDIGLARSDEWGPWFVAAFSGTCAGCGRDIGPGMQIRADGRRGYRCEDCGQILGEWLA